MPCRCRTRFFCTGRDVRAIDPHHARSPRNEGSAIAACDPTPTRAAPGVLHAAPQTVEASAQNRPARGAVARTRRTPRILGGRTCACSPRTCASRRGRFDRGTSHPARRGLLRADCGPGAAFAWRKPQWTVAHLRGFRRLGRSTAGRNVDAVRPDFAFSVRMLRRHPVRLRLRAARARHQFQDRMFASRAVLGGLCLTPTPSLLSIAERARAKAVVRSVGAAVTSLARDKNRSFSRVAPYSNHRTGVAYN